MSSLICFIHRNHLSTAVSLFYYPPQSVILLFFTAEFAEKQRLFPLVCFLAQPLRPLPSTNLGYAVRATLRARGAQQLWKKQPLCTWRLLCRPLLAPDLIQVECGTPQCHKRLLIFSVLKSASLRPLRWKKELAVIRWFNPRERREAKKGRKVWRFGQIALPLPANRNKSMAYTKETLVISNPSEKVLKAVDELRKYKLSQLEKLRSMKPEEFSRRVILA